MVNMVVDLQFLQLIIIFFLVMKLNEKQIGEEFSLVNA